MKFVGIAVMVVGVLFVGSSKCEDLILGTTVGAQMVYMDQVKLSNIPLTTRTKNVFFSSDRNQVIKGISAIDLDGSKGQAIVTAGGIGSSFANIRIKSQKGDGLNYQIQIFA